MTQRKGLKRKERSRTKKLWKKKPRSKKPNFGGCQAEEGQRPAGNEDLRLDKCREGEESKHMRIGNVFACMCAHMELVE